MIRRTLQQYLLRDARLYPLLTLTGPRQSGKTTLARATFPQHSQLRCVHRSYLVEPHGRTGPCECLADLRRQPRVPAQRSGGAAVVCHLKLLKL